MKSKLALARAAHLNNFISALRDIGAPVDRALAHSKLPQHVEETPDLYISIPIAMEWIARTGHDLPAMELGLIGAQASSLSSLRPIQQAAIMTAQTGLTRLESLAALSRFEDSVLEMTLRPEGDDVRVICDMKGLGRHPHLCFAEWLNLQAVISVMRSVAGPKWCPSEMCFISPHHVTEAIHTAFPHTWFRVGQPHTSVVVERSSLALSTQVPEPRQPALQAKGPATSKDLHVSEMEGWEFVSLLRKMIQPYLTEGRTGVAFAAEMAGVSTRTLQRRLKLCGNSYSQLLQEARFELARKNLENPSLKVIDVAMLAGYESPQHFTRAFRRFTGITPTGYRHQTLNGAGEVN